MKIKILIILILICSLCEAQVKIKIYHEQEDNSVKIYADNEEYCPVSAKVDFTVTNFNIEGGNNKIYVVEPLAKKQLLTTLSIIKEGKKLQLSYNFAANYGNASVDNFDKQHAYSLPYSSQNSYSIVQGYNGNFSHQNEYSLDFGMPIGSEITAIRGGVVVFIEQSNSKHCDKEDCKKFNNFITIYHADGTFASYVHIRQRGAKVKIGEQVTQGQLIGYSGDVGWTQGPHLHLIVYKQKLDRIISVDTRYKIGVGEKLETLVQGNKY